MNGRTDEVLRVQVGERVRLRLLNAANGRVFAPDFSGLDAKIVAVDGLYLRAPIDPGRFELAPGNRLDIDLTVRGAAAATLAIVDRFYPQRPNHLADIQITGLGSVIQQFASPARARVPMWEAGLSTPITKEFLLNARRGGPYGIEWTFNGEAFAGHENHHAALSLKRGAWSRLRFVNESYRLHPIHLHGMFFRLLARNGKPVGEPFFRDTVLVHGRETIDIGVVPLDEGAWMMHCHILEHAEAGMMTIIEVGGSPERHGSVSPRG